MKLDPINVWFKECAEKNEETGEYHHKQCPVKKLNVRMVYAREDQPDDIVDCICSCPCHKPPEGAPAEKVT